MALITGILLDPANQAMPGVNISLHSLETSQTVLNTVEVSVTTAADGRYTMQVPAGFYSVSLNKTGHRSAQVGKFRVYDDSPSGDLNKFLKAPLTALTPEWFTRIEDERKKAEAEAADARVSKLAAQTAVQQASDIAAQSQAHANQAKAEADRAAQVAGLDTVNQAVDAALAGQHVFAQNEVGMAVMRAMNMQRYAASGFAHWGLHLDKHYINQGMWSYIDSNSANKLYMGLATSNPSAANVVSSTRYPVIHMAGFLTKLKSFNNTNEDQGRILLPPAPDGTVVYDRSTGESINYLTDVDPKYGDVAATKNEAVRRAFEGLIRNGDFRLGKEYWSDYAGGSCEMVDGALRVYGTEANGGAASNTVPLSAGTYEITIEWGDFIGTTSLGYLRFAGFRVASVPDTHANSTQTYSWTLTEPVSAGNLQFVHWVGALGHSVDVKSITVFRKGQEVVTARVDMFGLEGFLRKINPGDFVYPNGLIQSKATSMDGIATSDEVGRPDSFFAVYTGDTISRGLGVDFHARSVIEQDAMTGDPDNNIIRLNDGSVAQWCIRQRSFAGPGNGYWQGTSPEEDPAAISNPSKLVRPQGKTDNDSAFTNASPYFYGSSVNQFKNVYGSMKGVFGAANYNNGQGQSNGLLGVNGLCFFMVLGTVSRLNQGAYHPTLNPLGTGAFINDLGTTASWSWHATLLNTPTVMKHCFIKPESVYPYTDGYQYPNNGSKGPVGSIGSTISGRPDRRYYDAVYSDDLGGVVDYRKSAHDMGGVEQAAVIRQQLEGGVYRGKEKLLVNNQLSITQFGSDGLVTYITKGQTSGYTMFAKSESLIFHNGHVYQTWPHFNDYWIQIRRYINGVPVAGDYKADIDLNKPFYFVPKGNVDMEKFSQLALFDNATFVEVSGNFTVIEVIGNPNEIIKVPELKNGWCGCWNPVIPDGNIKTFMFSRKSVRGLGDSYGNRIYTTDEGATWAGSTLSFTNALENGYSSSHPANHVQINYYQAFAKVTNPSLNRPVHNHHQGIGNVYISADGRPERGSTLIDSLLGRSMTTESGFRYCHSALLNYSVNPLVGDLIYSPGFEPHHHPTLISSADGYAAKILINQRNVNGAASMQIHAQEITYDSTAGNWGDGNGMLQIANEDKTYTDDNGHTLKLAVHELAIPYGYTKNNS